MSDWEIISDGSNEDNDQISNAMDSQQAPEPGDNRSPLDWFNEEIGDKRLAPLGAGFLNAPLSMAANVGNLALSPFTDKRIPQPELGQYLDPEHSKLNYAVGNLAGSLYPGAKAFGAAGKIPGLGKGSGFTGNAIKGAGLGAALSPEDSRGMGAALGGGLSLLPSIAGITSAGIGKNIIDSFKNLKKGFNKDYGNFFKKAGHLGVDRIPTKMTQSDVNLLGSYLPARQEKILAEALKSGSLKDMHEAQSAFGKVMEKLETKRSKSSLDPIDKKALDTATKLKDDIQLAINRELMKKGGLDLPFEYSNLSNRYKTEMGPYLDQPAIRAGAKSPTKKGYLNPSDVTAAIQGKEGTPFRNALGNEYPELEINKLLQSPLAKKILGVAATGAGLGGTAALGWDALKGGL